MAEIGEVRTLVVSADAALEMGQENVLVVRTSGGIVKFVLLRTGMSGWLAIDRNGAREGIEAINGKRYLNRSDVQGILDRYVTDYGCTVEVLFHD